jgi:hypothetical protein
VDVKSAGVWAVLVSAELVVVVVVVEVEEELNGISKYEVITGGSFPFPLLLLLWPTMVQVFRFRCT